MSDTAPTPAPAASQVEKGTKPPKPDEAAFKKELEKAEKEHKAVMAQLNAIKEKIELALPNKNKEKENQSPAQKRRQELISELNQIRQKQAGFKNARASRTDQIKRLDEQMRSRMAEQKANRAKVPYKSVEELDDHVRELESKVETGRMKLVDEKKALSEISAARKMRKNFGQLNEAQKAIDDLKAKIKEVKESGEDPEQKQLSERYTELQTELDGLKAQSDEAFKNLNSLRDERTKLQAEQQEKFQAMRKVKDDFYGQKRAFNQWEREAKDKARERQRAERDRIVKERKKADAERFLEEASNPAFLEEIRRANSLLQFLDPSAKPTEKAPLLADSGLAAQAQRKVDSTGMKGMKVLKKDDEEEYFPAAKKGKKGKKQAGGAGDSSSKFNCPPSVVEDCSYLGLDPPMSQAEVPEVVEKVKAKLAKWKEDQDSETKKNIEKARKELERLEKEGEAGDEGANGVADKKVDEVASKMEETSVKDTKDE